LSIGRDVIFVPIGQESGVESEVRIRCPLTLLAQCESFMCKNGHTNCCCRRLLFCQLDFTTQKSHLEEFVTSRGHICDFYLKYHCKLNVIEQYWGAAKFCYRNTTHTTNIIEMEKNMLTCLDDISLIQIIRYGAYLNLDSRN
jgi:hypothetical protein